MEAFLKNRWRKSFYFTFLLLSASSLFAQTVDSDTIYTFLHELPEHAKSFTTDQLRQCYLISPQNEVIKYDADGNELFRFNNNTLGALAYVDATDPFNILLYYPDFLTVILLDRTLNKTGEYILYDFDILEGYGVGISNDNNLWIYDDRAFKIKKINTKGEVLIESDDLSMILNTGIKPNIILERHNWVYVNDPEIGILQFDLYGTYVKTIPIKSLNTFQILDNNLLVYLSGNEVFAFNLQSLTTKKVPLPESIVEEDRIRLQKDRIYIQHGKRIMLYSF